MDPPITGRRRTSFETVFWSIAARSNVRMAGEAKQLGLLGRCRRPAMTDHRALGYVGEPGKKSRRPVRGTDTAPGALFFVSLATCGGKVCVQARRAHQRLARQRKEVEDVRGAIEAVHWFW